VTLIASALIILLLPFVSCLAMHWNEDRLERSLRTSIQRELPIGSSYEATLAFLERHHIAHGVLIGGDKSFPEFGNTLDAGVHNPFPCFFVSGGISLRFEFSKNKDLTGFSEAPIWTGP
jgi:hypothetical protein